jgi:hypothetical protein
MKKILSISVIMIATLLVSCTNREMGTVGGAAIGGVAGSALTGAIGGGVVGNQLTR